MFYFGKISKPSKEKEKRKKKKETKVQKVQKVCFGREKMGPIRHIMRGNFFLIRHI
jgi:hypothetical protein